jgi:membrane fusion protein, heavy metal efflux system
MKHAYIVTVLSVLVGAGAVFLPPPIALGGTPASTRQACPHGIDAAKCPFCTPSLIESEGMCREHGVAEAVCIKCRPYLVGAFKAASDWCAEHSVPESQCTTCHPNLALDILAEPDGEPAPSGDTPRSRRVPDRTCRKTDTEIILASAEVAGTVDLGFERAAKQPVSPPLERSAEVAYNGNRYAHLSSRAAGTIAEVERDLGEVVRQGDVLAVVDSVDLGAAKSELLLALETVNLWQTTATQQRSLVDRGAGIEREAFEAETKLAESRIALARARQLLRNFGLTAGQVDGVEQDGDTSSLLELTAPFDGLIVEREAVAGELVEAGAPLFAVADVGVMWAMIDLRESDVAMVQPGQTVALTVDGLPGENFQGRLTWISTQLDPRTRTLRARAELDNGAGRLRANMFGRAQIAGADAEAVTVPKEAVQWEGCCNVVFVRADDAGTRFKPVQVRLGAQTGDRWQVLTGLKGGETVATRGSFLLKTEILKGSIGAGCCEVGHLDK